MSDNNNIQNSTTTTPDSVTTTPNPGKLYKGSCHCKAIQYEATLDLYSKGTTRLSGNEELISNYQFGSKCMNHYFCSKCGTHTHGKGYLDFLGDFYSVNISSIDDLTPEELDSLVINYNDGANNQWFNKPAHYKYL
eukprot:gene3719-4632_t